MIIGHKYKYFNRCYLLLRKIDLICMLVGLSFIGIVLNPSSALVGDDVLYFNY